MSASGETVKLKAEGESAAMTEWHGPRIKLSITADKTEVVTSTDVIGRDEFRDSLFREMLERKLAGLKKN